MDSAEAARTTAATAERLKTSIGENTRWGQQVQETQAAKALVLLQTGGITSCCGLLGAEPEIGAVVYITRQASLGRILQGEQAVLWTQNCGTKPVRSVGSTKHPLFLAYRLGKRIFAQPVITDQTGKQMLGKVKKRSYASSTIVTETEAASRFIPPTAASREALRELHRSKIPQFKALLESIEAHPGFDWNALPNEEVVSTPLMKFSPTSKGLLMTQLKVERGVQQALMYLDVRQGELKIIGAINGKPIAGNGCSFSTLQGALTAFPQWAATVPFKEPSCTAKLSRAETKTVKLIADGTGASKADSVCMQPVGVPADIKIEEEWSAPATPIHVEEGIRLLQSSHVHEVRQGLGQILELDAKNPGTDEWIGHWIASGALSAVINAATRLENPEEEDEVDMMLIEAAGILISSTNAAREFTRELSAVLQQEQPGLLLLELVHAALAIPAVRQAASQEGLGESLLHILQQQERPMMKHGSDQGSTLKPSAVHKEATSASHKVSASPPRSPTKLPLSSLGSIMEVKLHQEQDDLVPQNESKPSFAEGHVPSKLKIAPNHRAAPVEEARLMPALGKLKVPVPSLRLSSVDNSPASTSKPTRSERRLAAQSKGSFSVITPVKSPFAPKPHQATPPTSHRSDRYEVGAVEKLEALGSAMGESLVAGDLAALISHKRAASLRRGSSMSTRSAFRPSKRSDHVRSHSLFGTEDLTHRSSETRSPLSTARESELGQNTARAQMTSRLASYRSYVSQDSLQDESVPHELTDSRLLILQSLLAICPTVAEQASFAQSCAEIVSNDLLDGPALPHGVWYSKHIGLVDRPLLSESIKLVHMAEAPLQTADVYLFHGYKNGSSSDRRSAFIPAAVTKLAHLLGNTALEELSRCQYMEVGHTLLLMTLYVEKAVSPKIAAEVLQQCDIQLRSFHEQFKEMGPTLTWQADQIQLFIVLLRFYTALCQLAEGDKCLGHIMQLLLLDHNMLDVWQSAASSITPTTESHAGTDTGQGAPAVLKLTMMHFFASLLCLIKKSRLVNHSSQRSSEPGKIGTMQLSESQSDQHITGRPEGDIASTFGFLLDVPSGLAYQLLEKTAKAGHEGTGRQQSLLLAILQLLNEAAPIADCPFVLNKEQVDQLVHFLWLQFAMTYTSPKAATTAVLCKAYLQVLKALIQTGKLEVRRRFYQLRVMEFLVRELSLEQEVQQLSHLPSAFAGAAASPPPPSAAGSVGTSKKQAELLKSVPISTIPSLKLGMQGKQNSLTYSQQEHYGIGIRPAHPHIKLIGDTNSAECWEAASAASSLWDDASSASVSYAPTSFDSCSISNGAGLSRLPSSESILERKVRPRQTQSLAQPVFVQMKQLTPMAQELDSKAKSGEMESPDQLCSKNGSMASVQIQMAKPPIVQKLDLALGIGKSTGKVPKLPLSSFEALNSIKPKPVSPMRGHSSPQNSPRIGSVGRRISHCSSVYATSPLLSSQASEYFEETASVQSGSLSFPPGFIFSGDVDEDLERLEEWENQQNGRIPGLASESDTAQQKNNKSCSSVLKAEPPVPKLLAIPSLSFIGHNASSAAGLPELAPEQNNNCQRGTRICQSGGRTGPQDCLSSIQPSDVYPQRAIVPSLRLSLTAIEDEGMGKGKMQAVLTRKRSPEKTSVELPFTRTEPLDGLREDVMQFSDIPIVSYVEERTKRMIYADGKLHSMILSVVFELLFDQEAKLDACYCSRDPSQERQLNVLHLLYHHLSHEANLPLIPELVAVTESIGSHASLLLRMLCRQLFPAGLYKPLQLLARGAYAQVYAAEQPSLSNDSIIVKLVDIPTSIHDQCRQFDVFNEVSILKQLEGHCGSMLLDYGLDSDHFVLVQRRYRASLSAWRQRQPKNPRQQLKLYLNIFNAVTEAVKELRSMNVVHFDLKGDNILLEPKEGCDEENFWHPVNSSPPFRVVLADFGESKKLSAIESDTTVRNRGTEFIKSPEMLLIANASKKEAKWYDRRKRQGAGAPSDIWSLGCLLYEIITGDYLFEDDDWIRFFIRVTQSKEVVPEERISCLREYPALIDLLKYILIRLPIARPSPEAICSRIPLVIMTLPEYKRSPGLKVGDPRPVQPRQSRDDFRDMFTTHPSMREDVIDSFWARPAAVTENCLLGSLHTLEVADLRTLSDSVQQIVILCSMNLDDGSSLGQSYDSTSELLHRFSMDTRLHACIVACAAAEIQCQLLPLEVRSKDGPIIEDSDPCIHRLAVRASELKASSKKLLLVGSAGYEGHAAVAAVMLKMQLEQCTCYQAFTHLLQGNAALLITPANAKQLQVLAGKRLSKA